jgi:protein arginine phosphatase
MGKQTFSGRKPYILFLCTGNTCRSPMAQGILQNYLDEAGIAALEVRTAGVMTIPGLMPTQECRQILLKEGIDISGHRSHQLTTEMIKQAKLVLGMTSFHVQMALRMTESARGKTYLLKEYTGSDPKNGQIQDPMGCTLEVYKKVYREIKAACKRLVKMALLGAIHSPARLRATMHKKGAVKEEMGLEMLESMPAPSKDMKKAKAAKATVQPSREVAKPQAPSKPAKARPLPAKSVVTKPTPKPKAAKAAPAKAKRPSDKKSFPAKPARAATPAAKNKKTVAKLPHKPAQKKKGK